MNHLTLSYYDGDGHTRTFISDGSPFKIGSAPSCAVSIEGLEPEVCEIYLAQDGYYAHELDGRVAISDRPGPGYLVHNGTLTLDDWLSLRVDIEAAPSVVPDPRLEAATPRASQDAGVSPVSAAGSRTAVVLGLLLPGGGQAYNGQPFKGAFVLLATVLVIPWIWSLVDARSTAARLAAAGGRTRRGGPLWFILHGWFAVNVALTVLLVLTLTGVLQ